MATAPASVDSADTVAAAALAPDPMGEAPAVNDETADSPDQAVEAAAIEAPPTEALAAASAPAAGNGGDLEGLTEYIPRPQLSVPPTPQTPAIMSPPQGNYPPERITGILSLYIDETGRVHHIVANGAPMPPEFEEIARKTFMSLTFRPGVLDGTPVKSRIRIEVVFDNTPLLEDKIPH